MNTTFTINRSGEFKGYKPSGTQCRRHGHRTYMYEIRAVCGEKLDHKGFIIDHNEIDDAVQQAVKDVTLSCEILCKKIAEEVMLTMSTHRCEVKQIDVKVKPKVRKQIAFMELTIKK